MWVVIFNLFSHSQGSREVASEHDMYHMRDTEATATAEQAMCIECDQERFRTVGQCSDPVWHDTCESRVELTVRPVAPKVVVASALHCELQI